MKALQNTALVAVSAIIFASQVHSVRATDLDLFLPPGGLSIASAPRVEGQPVRLYAQAKTAEPVDTYGSITFLIENESYGSPQPISIVNGVADGVFISWIPAFGGYVDITAIATLVNDTDTNPSNNSVTIKDVFIDYDTDGDGVGNAQDTDDDNDGIPDDLDPDPLHSGVAGNNNQGGTGSAGSTGTTALGGSTGSNSSTGTSGSTESTGSTVSTGSTESNSSSGSSGSTGSNSSNGSTGSSSSNGSTGLAGSSGSAVPPSSASGSAAPTQGGKTADFISTSTDSDNDGVPNAVDAFPANPSESTDTDNDGLGNNTDLDDDNDNLPDVIETQAGTNPLLANTPEEVQSVFDQIDQGVLGLKETAPSSQMPYTWFSALFLLVAIGGAAYLKKKDLALYFKKWKRKK